MGALRKIEVGRGPQLQKDESEVRWLISYSDFMMQLVCLFILLYSVSTHDRGKADLVAGYWRAAVGLGERPLHDQPPDGPHLQVGDAPPAGGRGGPGDVPSAIPHRIRQVRAGWLITFDRPLFETGSPALAAEVRETLDQVALELGAYGGQVEVTAAAGDPPGDVLEGDALKLAQARARAVWEHLSRNGFEGALDPRFMSAAGRQAVEEGEGRRIEILLKVR
jgi:flagellar motor protein MotB